MSDARYTDPFVFGPCGWRVYIRKLKLGAGRHGYIQKVLLWMILMEPLSPKTEIEHEVLDYHSLASKHILPRVGESLNFSKVLVLSTHCFSRICRLFSLKKFHHIIFQLP